MEAEGSFDCHQDDTIERHTRSCGDEIVRLTMTHMRDTLCVSMSPSEIIVGHTDPLEFFHCSFGFVVIFGAASSLRACEKYI